jgi:hypothetical protein
MVASFNSMYLDGVAFCYINYSCLRLLHAGCGYYLFQNEVKNRYFYSLDTRDAREVLQGSLVPRSF